MAKAPLGIFEKSLSDFFCCLIHIILYRFNQVRSLCLHVDSQWGWKNWKSAIILFVYKVMANSAAMMAQIALFWRVVVGVVLLVSVVFEQEPGSISCDLTSSLIRYIFFAWPKVSKPVDYNLNAAAAATPPSIFLWAFR